jgi:mono/diheme cytochrome c family protein
MTIRIILIILFISSLSLIAQTPSKPSTIKIKKDNSDLIAGRKIYVQNCAVCHDNPKLGPKLNGVTEKYPKQWVLDFTVNNELMIRRKDKDAIKIWLAWKKSAMTVYDGFTKETLDQLYVYLKSLKK